LKNERNIKMSDCEIGHFDIVRLKKDIEIADQGSKFIVKKNSIGISLFEPYAGTGVCFEKLPRKILVRFDEKIMEYVFKNVRSTVRIQHIRDDVQSVGFKILNKKSK